MKNTLAYGYKLQNGKVITNDTECEIVVKIFDLYTQGYSLVTVAEKIMADFPNEKWDKAKVRRIIKNPKYKGTADYPMIVSEEIYNSANHLCTVRNEKATYPQLLKSLEIPVICGNCNYIMKHHHDARRRGGVTEWWSCKECDRKVRIEDIDFLNSAMNIISALCGNPDMVIPPIELTPTDTPEIKKLERQINTAIIKYSDDIDMVKSDIRELATMRIEAISDVLYNTESIRLTLKKANAGIISEVEILNDIGTQIVFDAYDEMWIYLTNELMAGKEYKNGYQNNSHREESSNCNTANYTCIPIGECSA